MISFRQILPMVARLLGCSAPPETDIRQPGYIVHLSEEAGLVRRPRTLCGKRGRLLVASIRLSHLSKCCPECKAIAEDDASS